MLDDPYHPPRAPVAHGLMPTLPLSIAILNALPIVAMIVVAGSFNAGRLALSRGEVARTIATSVVFVLVLCSPNLCAIAAAFFRKTYIVWSAIVTNALLVLALIAAVALNTGTIGSTAKAAQVALFFVPALLNIRFCIRCLRVGTL